MHQESVKADVQLSSVLSLFLQHFWHFWCDFHILTVHLNVCPVCRAPLQASSWPCFSIKDCILQKEVCWWWRWASLQLQDVLPDCKYRHTHLLTFRVHSVCPKWLNRGWFWCLLMHAGIKTNCSHQIYYKSCYCKVVNVKDSWKLFACTFNFSGFVCSLIWIAVILLIAKKYKNPSLLRPLHTGVVFFVLLIHTSSIFPTVCHEYFHTERECYTAEKQHSFSVQGRFFCVLHCELSQKPITMCGIYEDYKYKTKQHEAL